MVPFGDIIVAFLLFCALGLPVFMKMVTLPLNVVSSSLVDIHTDPHAHILPAAGGKVEGEQFIRALTVRLQGALCLHQFTQQISTTQSLLLHLPHASPLYVNNKPLRATWEKNSVWLF